MKLLLAVVFLFQVQSSFATNEHIRDICENAYYATDYVKLHEYSVVIDWSRISDHAHLDLDNVLYGRDFKVTLEKDLEGPLTLYHIKEVGSRHGYTYQIGLDILNDLSGGKVKCLYNL